jgi:hypothetical protein
MAGALDELEDEALLEEDEASVEVPLEHAEVPRMATAVRPAAANALR